MPLLCVHAQSKRCRRSRKPPPSGGGSSLRNNNMRDVLDFTLKASVDCSAEDANNINGEDVLIIDDTISRGQTIKEACQIIQDTYAPKSITVLTLLSKLY